MFITDKEVKRVLSNTRNYQVARQYYYNDCVDEIYITYNEKMCLYKIKGTVIARGASAFSVIEVNAQSKVIEYQCNCFWCDEYAGCAHVGAILFKVQELSPDDFPFYYKNDREAKRKEQLRIYEEQRKQREEVLRKQRIEQKANHTRERIQYYKQQVSTVFFDAIAPVTYKIYATLEEQYGYLCVKFKVGNIQKYVIKNIADFLQSIMNHEEVSYGKKLTFKHNRKVFDDASLLQIDFMIQGLSLQEDDEVAGTKSIVLHKPLIDVFYDTYNQIPLPYINFKAVEKTHYPKILITYEKGSYRLVLDNASIYIMGSKHVYIYENDSLGRVVLDEEGKAIALLEELSNEDEIVIDENDFEDFYMYVLSDIQEYLEIVGETLPTVIEEDNIILYGDIDDTDNICISLEYEYDDGVKKQGFDISNNGISMLARKVEGYVAQYAKIDTMKCIAYIDSHQHSAYNFIQLGLPYLAKYCDIFVSDALKQVGTKTNISMSVGVTLKNDLLAIDLDSIDIPKNELASVLDAYRRKKKFYKLQGGKLLYLESDTLEEIDTMLTSYNVSHKDIVDGHLDLELYRAFSMENIANASDTIMYDRSAIFKDVIERFSNIKNVEFPIAKTYESILRDYQKYGYHWLQMIGEYGFSGVLADDMGLGKTLQVIALLDTNRSEERLSIVVCPSSLILNWEDEVQKFSPDLKCKSIYGTAAKRKADIESSWQYDVLITSYDYLRRDVEIYRNTSFYYIILDEAQYIKNPKTKNAITVKQLHGKHKLALTGTPIENSLAELWSIFDFLMRGYLHNYNYFQTHYEIPIVKDKNEAKQLELKHLISPFILRRTKQEVLTELPDKIEKTLPIQFSEEEKKLYVANLAKISKELQAKLDMDKVDRVAVLAMLTKLRQICCEPRVAFEGIDTISSKMKGCLEVIRTFHASKKKVLLFSSFTSVLELLSEELHKEGISYYTITGSTKKERRRQLVKDFQEDDTSVFLISLKAGGTGLNLTAAEGVIHFDPWWNISAQNQATDRAYRLGQRNTVQVFKLIIKDSIEERILELQEKKKGLSDTFVEGNDGSITTMTNEDLLQLFSM